MASGRPGRRHLKIGELERALGVTRDQVHHYVELGLVPAPEKSAATLAWYGPEHVAAVARVRAIRDAGGSLGQAQRWLVASLAHAGPADCATLTRWVVGHGSGRATDSEATPARVPVDAVVSMIDAGLARIDPDALVGGAVVDPSVWLQEIAVRWVEREEHARVAVAREALSSVATARLARWLPIDGARVEGGVMRAAALDLSAPGEDAAGDEERARLGVMLPSHAPVPLSRLPPHGGWVSVARGIFAMRARRWDHARTALSTVMPHLDGAVLARVLGWCNEAVIAGRAGDGVLSLVPGLGELRAVDTARVSDLYERLRLRWTVAVTWLALPARWVAKQPEEELAALITELASIAATERSRATGELDVIEANALLALADVRLRSGDRVGSVEAARRAASFGGAVALEAARRVRRASRAV